MKAITKNIVLKMLTGAATTALTVAGAATGAVPMPAFVAQNEAVATTEVEAVEDEQVNAIVVEVVGNDAAVVEADSNAAPVEVSVNEDAPILVYQEELEEAENKKTDTVTSTTDTTITTASTGTAANIGTPTTAVDKKEAEAKKAAEEAEAKKAAETNYNTDDGSDGCITVTVECSLSYIDGDPTVGWRYCGCGSSFDIHEKSGVNSHWDAHLAAHAANGENVRWNDEIDVIESENVQNEDTVVGHRYCVCGAQFDIRKNSGLDNDAWMAHAKGHAAKGEVVRWTDK